MSDFVGNCPTRAVGLGVETEGKGKTNGLSDRDYNEYRMDVYMRVGYAT